MVHAFDGKLYLKMLEASKKDRKLAAAIKNDNLTADVYRELASLLQKKGKNPEEALMAARVAELEKQAGLPISAAIERQKMYIGRRASQRETVGNFNNS